MLPNPASFFFEVPTPLKGLPTRDKLGIPPMLLDLTKKRGAFQLVELVCSGNGWPCWEKHWHKQDIQRNAHFACTIQHLLGTNARDTYRAMRLTMRLTTGCKTCCTKPRNDRRKLGRIGTAVKRLLASKKGDPPSDLLSSVGETISWRDRKQHIIAFVIREPLLTVELAKYIFHLANPSILLDSSNKHISNQVFAWGDSELEKSRTGNIYLLVRFWVVPNPGWISSATHENAFSFAFSRRSIPCARDLGNASD